MEKDPTAEKWIKRLLGSEEFLNGKERWCIWLNGISEQELADMPSKHPEIHQRIEKVRAIRSESKRKETKILAETPHLFGEIRHPTSGNYILVPSTTSERREYVPMDFFNTETISSNANLMIPNATLYEFSILTSAMHNDWMRTVAGRLESRYRYSGTIVYNNFPWPEADEAKKAHIAELAEDILLIRADYPDQTLAQLYDPDKMPPPLKEAHLRLDAAVDRLYRAKPFSDGMERVEFLFDLYEKAVNGQTTP